MFFTPKRPKKATTVFSTKLKTVDVVKIRGEILVEETKSYLLKSMESYQQNRPKKWQEFFKGFLGQTNISEGNQHICDTIFQMAHSLAAHRFTPLSIGFAQAIHDACRSKRLISIGNRLGMWPSYPTLEGIERLREIGYP